METHYNLETFDGKHCVCFSSVHWPPKLREDGHIDLIIPMSYELASLLSTFLGYSFRANDIILENLLMVNASPFFIKSEYEMVQLTFDTIYNDIIEGKGNCFTFIPLDRPGHFHVYGEEYLSGRHD